MKNKNKPKLPPLAAAFAQLLTHAQHQCPEDSIVWIAPHHDSDEDMIALATGVLALLGLLARTADEESTHDLRLALQRHSQVEMTPAQMVHLLHLATDFDSLAEAESSGLPLWIYPDGIVWTALMGYPVCYYGGIWKVPAKDKSQFLTAGTLGQAKEIVAHYARPAQTQNSRKG